jgi:hypothetical protein
MGYGRFDSDDWDNFKSTTVGKTTDEVFAARSMAPAIDPVKIAVREARDSKDSPNATPIILALDVTGSMGRIADDLARDGLGRLVQEILDRKPVSDPQIMVMGVGDADYDRAPLQVSQFEADIRIAEQLKGLFLEHGGGGNCHESYNLPWYFAARKTDIDCVKRGKKGLLFTFGDEECPEVLKAEHVREFVGDDIQGDIKTKDLLALVSQKYDVFHVVIEQGSHASSYRDRVFASWNEVLPQGRIIPLADYSKLPEVIVSVMQVHAGTDPKAVAASWDGSTAMVVSHAVNDMTAANDAGKAGVWRPKAGAAAPATAAAKVKKKR